MKNNLLIISLLVCTFAIGQFVAHCTFQVVQEGDSEKVVAKKVAHNAALDAIVASTAAKCDVFRVVFCWVVRFACLLSVRL